MDMDIGEQVLHPKYGIGQILEIDYERDRVTCFLAGEERFFTLAGAKSMIKAAKNYQGNGVECDTEAKSEKGIDIAGAPDNQDNAVTFYNCQYCGKVFKSATAIAVHTSQCKKNPSAKQWGRTSGTTRIVKNEAKKEDKKEDKTMDTIPDTNTEKTVVRGTRAADRVHVAELPVQTVKVVRNALTAKWLAFLKTPEVNTLSFVEVKAKFHDHLFEELGI